MALFLKVIEWSDDTKDRIVYKYPLKNAGREVNVMIAGHKCTTGCIDCYFNGMPADGDFFSRSVANGKFRVYEI